MKNFTINSEPIESLEWENERKGKINIVGIIEYETDNGEMLVKIVTDDNFAGVGAEYAFVEYKFPGYKVNRQALLQASINGMRIHCDELTISNGTDEKQIYFDISDFFGKGLD
jgi:hypothetical protein